MPLPIAPDKPLFPPFADIPYCTDDEEMQQTPQTLPFEALHKWWQSHQNIAEDQGVLAISLLIGRANQLRITIDCCPPASTEEFHQHRASEALLTSYLTKVIANARKIEIFTRTIQVALRYIARRLEEESATLSQSFTSHPTTHSDLNTWKAILTQVSHEAEIIYRIFNQHIGALEEALNAVRQRIGQY